METDTTTSNLELGDQSLRVLRLAEAGLTDKQIAAELGIKPSTVDWHWRTILRRTASSSRTQAVARSIRADVERQIDDLSTRIEILAKERNRLTLELSKPEGGVDGAAIPTGLFSLAERILGLSGAVVYERDFTPPYTMRHVSDTARVEGYTPSVLKTRDVRLVVHPEDLARTLQGLEEAVSGQHPRLTMVYRAVQESGDWQWRLDRQTLDFDRGVMYGLSLAVSDLVAAGALLVPECRYWLSH